MQELKEEIKDIVREILPGQHHVTTTPPPFFSKFFNGGRSFKSPWPTWEERTFFQVLKWKKEGRVLGLPGEGHLIGNLSPTADSYAATFPPVTPDAAALQNPPSDAIQAFWIGHATVLVQIEGVAFITDPVFEPRCSPLSFAGPLRITPPALTPTTTPPLPSNLDFVVISHNHYDHLCERSIKAIHARQGDSISWFVPLGLKSWFLKRGIKAENVHELDWWQEFEFKGVKIVFLPAQHWSQRGIGYDRNSTLWGSWAVLGAKLRFWFAGDTGYFPGFKEIGEKIGPFDLAAIPTGAYSPRWYMQTQHIDAAEALTVHKEVQSMRSIAIHCATFSLTDEPLDEPVLLLKQSLEKSGMKGNEFVTLRHGAHIVTAGGVDVNTAQVMPLSAAAEAAAAPDSGYVWAR